MITNILKYTRIIFLIYIMA